LQPDFVIAGITSRENDGGPAANPVVGLNTSIKQKMPRPIIRSAWRDHNPAAQLYISIRAGDPISQLR
jgi:hypothetical protein